MQELDLLDDDATVFKLIGPAMIKQDLVEAKTNVSKRLEYIQGEMRRISDKISTLENKARDQQAVVSGSSPHSHVTAVVQYHPVGIRHVCKRQILYRL